MDGRKQEAFNARGYSVHLRGRPKYATLTLTTLRGRSSDTHRRLVEVFTHLSVFELELSRYVCVIVPYPHQITTRHYTKSVVVDLEINSVANLASLSREVT